MIKQPCKVWQLLLMAGAMSTIGGSIAAADPNDNDEVRAALERLTTERVAPVRRLSGKFGFVSQQVCVRTGPGAPGVDLIDPAAPNRLNVPSEIVTVAGSGTATLLRDGTFRIDSTNANEIRNALTAPASTPVTLGLHPACDGTYSIARDNRIKVNFACNITIDSQPGLVIEAAPFNLDGFVADEGVGFDLNLGPDRQRLSFKRNGMLMGEAQRICVQTFNFKKLAD